MKRILLTGDLGMDAGSPEGGGGGWSITRSWCCLPVCAAVPAVVESCASQSVLCAILTCAAACAETRFQPQIPQHFVLSALQHSTYIYSSQVLAAARRVFPKPQTVFPVRRSKLRLTARNNHRKSCVRTARGAGEALEGFDGEDV